MVTTIRKKIALITVLLLLFTNISANGEKLMNHHQVPDNPEDIRPLLIGTSIPQITLTKIDGSSFDLSKAIKEKPTVLIFYRGGWCPYCNLQLGQLQKIEKKIIELGYQIIAVSPDKPENLRASVQKHKLNYLLLSDSKMTGAISFGIAFNVDDKIVEKYNSFGIDLEKSSGEKHHLLPVPSVFIVGTDGIIKFSYVNPDYKIRLDSDVLIAAAKGALN